MSEKLTGIVDEIVNQSSGTGKKGAWTRTVFKLVDAGGNVHNVTTFAPFSDDLIGQTVSLTADYSAQYKNYQTVQGSTIEAVEGNGNVATAVAEQPKALTPLRPKRGRKPANQPATEKKSYEQNPPSPSKAPAEKQQDTREQYRKLAEEAVVSNITSAQHIAEVLDLGASVDLIQLADMVGRTMTAITIEAKRN